MIVSTVTTGVFGVGVCRPWLMAVLIAASNQLLIESWSVLACWVIWFLMWPGMRMVTVAVQLGLCCLGVGGIRGFGLRLVVRVR